MRKYYIQPIYRGKNDVWDEVEEDAYMHLTSKQNANDLIRWRFTEGEKVEYKTTDLYRAAFLQTKGLSMEVDRDSAGKVTFYFDIDDQMLKELLNMYQTGLGNNVNIKDYVNAIHELKNEFI